MPSRRPSLPRSAFTLVELLVVVGIISVLIAILMPALARIREHANRIACAANLRSMGQAMTMYVQQSRYYPGCLIGYSGGHYVIWPTRLRPAGAVGNPCRRGFLLTPGPARRFRAT